MKIVSAILLSGLFLYSCGSKSDSDDTKDNNPPAPGTQPPSASQDLPSLTLSGPFAAEKYSIRDAGDIDIIGGVFDLNNRGEMVGYTAGENSFGAFLYNGNSLAPIPGLPENPSTAFSINGRGDIVGNFYESLSGSCLYLYKDGKISPVENTGGKGLAYASINDKGAIVASFQNSTERPGYEITAVIENGVVTPIPSLGGDQMTAAEINSEGLVVGSAQDSFRRFHAFSFKKGKLEDLGTFGFFNAASPAVSDKGQILINAWVEREGVYCIIKWAHAMALIG